MKNISQTYNSISRGFTLIELMITVAVVAILATVAIPSYNAIKIRSDRTIAMADMNDIALAEARLYSVNRAYTADFVDLNMASTTTATIGDGTSTYNYVIATQNINANFTVIATPTNASDKWLLRLSDAGIKEKKIASGTWQAGWP